LEGGTDPGTTVAGGTVDFAIGTTSGVTAEGPADAGVELASGDRAVVDEVSGFGVEAVVVAGAGEELPFGGTMVDEMSGLDAGGVTIAGAGVAASGVAGFSVEPTIDGAEVAPGLGSGAAVVATDAGGVLGLGFGSVVDGMECGGVAGLEAGFTEGIEPLGDRAAKLVVVLFELALWVVPGALRSRAIIPECLYFTAKRRAVSPSLSRGRTSAPFSSSSRAESIWPKSAAAIKAVRPSLALAFTSAPFSSRAATVSVWPRRAASMSAVFPWLSVSFTSAPLSRRLRTMSVLPEKAAHRSGVHPSLSLE